MNDDRIAQAYAGFVNNLVIPQMNAIYQGIYKEVRDASPEILASKITSLESKSINSFCTQLDDQAEQVAIDVMKDIGIPDVRIPMIWVKVRNSVKAPHAQLCNQKNYSMPSSKPSNSTVIQPSTPRVGKYILGIGAAVEVVSWLFLPSGNIWIPVVKGIGVLLMGAGAYQIARESKSEPRITLSEEAVKASKAESAKAVRQICEQQCDLNTGIFVQWVKEISNQLVTECANQI